MSNQDQNSNSQKGKFNFNFNAEAQTSGGDSGSAQKTDFKFDFKEQSEAEEVYRRPRSRAFLDAIEMIDVLSSNDEEIIASLKENLDAEALEEFDGMSNEEILEEIRLCIEEEFAGREFEVEKFCNTSPDKLIAIIATCYVDGCDIHAIDRKGNIVEHFNRNSKLPENYGPVRMAYRKHESCQCIEIYTNCFRIIDKNGCVTVETFSDYQP